MAVNRLGPPPVELATERFRKTYLYPDRLVRISTYYTEEPYFGISGRNRFDAPSAAAGAAEYGVCYLGTDLELTMAESILHDQLLENGRFQLARDQVDSHFVLYFEGSPLHLLNLTGPLLKRLGGSAELAGTSDYALTQRWSYAVHANPAGYDGFLYMSRHLNSRRAVALFDRASPKIHLHAYARLASAAGFGQAFRRLGVELI